MKYFINNNALKNIFSALAICLFVALPIATPYAVVSPAYAETGTTTPEDVGGESGEGSWWEEIGIWMGNTLLSLGGLVTSIGGSFLDTAVDHLVLNMGKMIVEGGTGLVIEDTWTIIRDLTNILFVAGFVYVGIRTILFADSAFTKRFLAQLVIGALLVNFSLFFTQIVIDVANVFAVEVNNLMVSGQDGNVALAFQHEMRVDGIYTPSTGTQLADITHGGSFTYFFMGFIFLIIAGFVFAMGALMLVMRFVALILIMIFSPLMIVAFAFPNLAGKAKVLVKYLFAYAFYAPVFLFFVYISLRVLDKIDFGSSGGFQDVLSTQSTSADAIDVFLQFGIATVFLVSALVVARSFSMTGGAMTVKWGQGLGNYARKKVGAVAGGATFGMAARLGRASGGRLGQATAGSKWANRMAVRGGLAGLAGRNIQAAGENVAGRSFDMRQIGGVGKKLGVGEGKKGGHTQYVKDVEKREQAAAKRLGSDDRVYEDLDVTDVKQTYDSLKKSRDDLLRELSNEKDPDKRNMKTKEIDRLEKILQGLENMKKTSYESAQKWAIDTGLRNPDEGLNEADWKHMQTFSRARDMAKNQPKEEYAANLRARNENMGIFKSIADFVGPEQAARDRAADSIMQEISKDNNKRLLDAIGDLKGSMKSDS